HSSRATMQPAESDGDHLTVRHHERGELGDAGVGLRYSAATRGEPASWRPPCHPSTAHRSHLPPRESSPLWIKHLRRSPRSNPTNWICRAARDRAPSADYEPRRARSPSSFPPYSAQSPEEPQVHMLRTKVSAA